jgi:hypothetical protein
VWLQLFYLFFIGKMRVKLSNFIIVHKDPHPGFEPTTSHTEGVAFTTALLYGDSANILKLRVVSLIGNSHTFYLAFCLRGYLFLVIVCLLK